MLAVGNLVHEQICHAVAWLDRLEEEMKAPNASGDKRVGDSELNSSVGLGLWLPGAEPSRRCSISRSPLLTLAVVNLVHEQACNGVVLEDGPQKKTLAARVVPGKRVADNEPNSTAWSGAPWIGQGGFRKGKLLCSPHLVVGLLVSSVCAGYAFPSV